MADRFAVTFQPTTLPTLNAKIGDLYSFLPFFYIININNFVYGFGFHYYKSLEVLFCGI